MEKEYDGLEPIRINKYLSDAGVCSRREADRLIEEGKITIDGKTAIMGQRVSDNNSIICNGVKVVRNTRLELIVFNKPIGIECTADLTNKDNIINYINYPTRIYPIGRLDKNSEGLILLTNDGSLVNGILKAVNYHEKEYVVKVNKKITKDFIVNMSKGVNILDTVTRKCEVTQLDEVTFKIILTQGLNRQIRRMCEALGYKVINLKRIRIMNIQLDKLSVGTYRKATAVEIKEIRKSKRVDSKHVDSKHVDSKRVDSKHVISKRAEKNSVGSSRSRKNAYR